MKKIALSLIAISSTLCMEVVFAGNMGPANISSNTWTGFYLGANAGGWWSSSHAANTVGSTTYVNLTGGNIPGSTNIANALAAVGTNSISIGSNGFIGGGQVGYNFQFIKKLVIGLDVDIDGLTQSETATIKNKVVNLVNFSESYTSSISINKKLDYLGTVRGRLGFLLTPTVLIYGAGGLAYGGASFNTSFIANESLGPTAYSTVSAQNNSGQTRTGWTAGGGLEWMLKSNLSAKVEYLYYDLGTINSNVVLNQILLGPPPVLWGAAKVYSSTRFAEGAARVGLNYHFG